MCSSFGLLLRLELFPGGDEPHVEAAGDLDQDPDPDEHVPAMKIFSHGSVTVSFGSSTLDVVSVATAT